MNCSDADDLFLADVAAGTADPFGHREHLRLALLAVRRSATREQALGICRDGIGTMAAARGAPGKYDEALTARWVARVAHAAARHPGSSLEALLAAEPELLGP